VPLVRQKLHLASCADFRDRLFMIWAFGLILSSRHLGTMRTIRRLERKRVPGNAFAAEINKADNLDEFVRCH
jgi:hypothetical protein